jgi:hypothetical protein
MDFPATPYLALRLLGLQHLTLVCDWPIIMGRLLEEPSTFSVVSLPPLKGIPETAYIALTPCPAKLVHLVRISLQCALYLKNKVVSWLYLFFHSREIPEIPYFALSPQSYNTWKFLRN